MKIPLSDKLDAMKQAAEEHLKNLGGDVVIPEAPHTRYCYDRGYYEGFLDALAQIKSWNDANNSGQLPADCLAAPDDKSA